MNTFLLLNALAFVAIVIYSIYLFAKVVATRVAYIRLGQKSEFDGEIKARLKKIGRIVFGQSKLLKDKKSGTIHVMMFYGLYSCSLVRSTYSLKVWRRKNICRLALCIPVLLFFKRLSH